MNAYEAKVKEKKKQDEKVGYMVWDTSWGVITAKFNAELMEWIVTFIGQEHKGITLYTDEAGGYVAVAYSGRCPRIPKKVLDEMKEFVKLGEVKEHKIKAVDAYCKVMKKYNKLYCDEQNAKLENLKKEARA